MKLFSHRQQPEKSRWLANPTTPAEAELRQTLDEAAARAADEVALRRVWARLAEMPELVPSPRSSRDVIQDRFEESRARRVRWSWIVAASLAGATATLAFMLLETKSQFRGDRAASAVAVPATEASDDGSAGRTQRSTLVAPATVRTGFGETLHLSLRGGTQVTVTSESTLVLDKDERPAVSAGEVQFQVPRQGPGQTFAVAAGHYRVVVIGTRFRVRVSQSHAAVGVDEGVVEIWTDHRIARVPAGGSWVSPGNVRVEANPAPASDPTATWTATATPPNASASKVAGPTAENRARHSREPGETRSSGNKRSLLGYRGGSGSRETLALAAPSTRSSSLSGAAPTTTPYENREVPAPRAAPPAPDESLFPTLPTVAPLPAPAPAPLDVAPLAIQARAARAAGDPRRALGLYRTLAQKGGAAGESAKYEIGQLLRDGMHQPREAISAWRLYRAQHPRGLLRVEADISVIETLVAIGDKVGAVAEATDFMRRYPDSERRAEVARMAGDLLRERGACAEAVAAYDVALGSSHGRRDGSDGAAYHRAICLLRGDQAQGNEALRTYLAAFPSGRFRAEAQRLLKGGGSAAAGPLPPP